MKKVLLATSLVALSATGALAQNITLSGDGRMGVAVRPGVAAAPAAVRNNIEGRVRFNFNARREGDNGLTFGGTMRLTQVWSNGTATASGPRNGSVFVEAGGLRVSMGDISGAIDNRVAIYGGGLGFTGAVGRPATHAGLLESDSLTTSGVRADFSAEGFGASVSYQPRTIGSGEISVAYSMSGFNVALGYRQGQNVVAAQGPSTHLSATYTAGDISVGALVSQFRPAASTTRRTSYRVWGTYDIGAIRLGLTHTVGVTEQATAVGVRYSLGGGAFMHGAVETRRARFGAVRPSRTGGEIGVTFAF